MIEADRLRERGFDRGAVRICGSGPESVGIAVERGVGWAANVSLHQIRCVALANGDAELFQALDVRIRQQAPAIGGETEHELSAAAHALLIHVDQVRQGLEVGVVVRMPEPMRLVQRRVGFSGTPAQIAVAVEDVPVLVGNDAVFVAGPADIGEL